MLLTWFLFLVHIWEVVRIYYHTVVHKSDLQEATRCMQASTPFSSPRKPYTHQPMWCNEMSPGMHQYFFNSRVVILIVI